MALCLASGALVTRLAVTAFTLAWTHSIEKVRWEEDWRVEEGRLVALDAWIKGHGAGMEPPEGARLEGGWWRYRPDLPPLPELSLARSGVVADYELCADGACRPLGSALPGVPADAAITLWACG